MRKRIAMAFAIIAAAFGITVGMGASPASAWQTEQSAEAVCVSNTANINVRFKNTEPDKRHLDMNVVAVDQQTGKSVNLGTVLAGGGVANGTIETGLQQIDAGTVRFNLTWSDGRGGVDSRKAHYSAVDCAPPVVKPSVSLTANADCNVISGTVTAGDGNIKVAGNLVFPDGTVVPFDLNPGESASSSIPSADYYGQTVSVQVDLGKKGGSQEVSVPTKDECTPPAPNPSASINDITECDVYETQLGFNNDGDAPDTFYVAVDGVQVLTIEVAANSSEIANIGLNPNSTSVVTITSASGMTPVTRSITTESCPSPFPSLTGTAMADCNVITVTLVTGDGELALNVPVSINGGEPKIVAIEPNSTESVTFDATGFRGQEITATYGQAPLGGSAKAQVPTEEQCTPPAPGTINVSGDITCAVVDGTAAISFAGVINNPDDLEIVSVSHPNGTVANAAFTYEVTYVDNLGKTQTATAEVAAEEDCTPPPPPPATKRVCELATGRVITIAESAFDSTKHGAVDNAACKPAPPTVINTGELLVAPSDLGGGGSTGGLLFALALLFGSLTSMVVAPIMAASRRNSGTFGLRANQAGGSGNVATAPFPTDRSGRIGT